MADHELHDVFPVLDTIDVHVLDSRNIETQHYNTMNDKLSDILLELPADHADLQGRINSANNALDGLTTKNITTGSVDTDRYNFILDRFTGVFTVMSDLSQEHVDNTATITNLINTRYNTLNGKADSALGHLSFIDGNGAINLSTLQSDLANDHAQTVTLINNLQATVNTLSAALAAQRKAQPSYNVVDETDFDQALHYLQPADFYLVTITAVPASSGEQPSDPLRYPHIGWGAVIGPNGSLDQLQQIDFANRCFTSSGVAPQGLELYCKPGTVGHVQACLNN